MFSFFAEQACHLPVMNEFDLLNYALHCPLYKEKTLKKLWSSDLNLEQLGTDAQFLPTFGLVNLFLIQYLKQ